MDTAIATAMTTIQDVQKLREKEITKYQEIATSNNIERKSYFDTEKTRLGVLMTSCVDKAETLRTDLLNENLSRETRIDKGEQLYSLNVIYQTLKAIQVIFNDWETKINDNARDVDDWLPILLSAARHPFNNQRLWIAMMENLALEISIDITKAGYESGNHMDDVIYGMMRTELDVFNSSMLLNTIRTKENRNKCFSAQFETIAGMTCALLAGNGSSYFTLAPAPPADPGRILFTPLFNTDPATNTDTNTDTTTETPAPIFHEQDPIAIPMKSNAAHNIVYNCFPQLYSECKVINTLGDLNMIRHLVPEASLQDKVDICSQKDKIAECFLDWSKCDQTFKEEFFAKLFSPFSNKLNNLNTDDYETDIDKTKGFLDSQLLLLGVNLKEERKVIIADMENHLNQAEPFTFKMDNGSYKVTALDAAAFLRNLEDTEKIAYFMDQEYLDEDLKAQEQPARILNSVIVTTKRQITHEQESFFRRLEAMTVSNSFKTKRVLETETAENPKAYLTLAYDVDDEAGLDLRIWALDSGLNVANLEDSMTTLPNIPEPVSVSISNPGGGDDNGGNGDGGDNGTGGDGTGTGGDGTNQSVYIGSTKILFLTIILVLLK